MDSVCSCYWKILSDSLDFYQPWVPWIDNIHDNRKQLQIGRNELGFFATGCRVVWNKANPRNTLKSGPCKQGQPTSTDANGPDLWFTVSRNLFVGDELITLLFWGFVWKVLTLTQIKSLFCVVVVFSPSKYLISEQLHCSSDHVKRTF